MNLQQAVQKLKDAGYSVSLATNSAKLDAARRAKTNKRNPWRFRSEEEVRQNFNKRIWNMDGSLFTERSLIRYARKLFKIGNSNLKNFSKRTRAAERDTIKTEQFDKIPQRGSLKIEDPWCWD
jgi:hypothetical protein